MARGMNHVFLVGAAARDPELRYTPSGTPVLELTVAGEDTVTGADGQPRTLPWYHRVSLLGKSGETIAEQVKAGHALLVEGSLEQRSWETPEGQKRSATSVKALRIEQLQRPKEQLISDAGGGVRLQNGVNEVTLVGNLGRDPELRYTSSGDAVASFALAVSESWKGRDGNWQERTHWIDVNAWRELAEQAAGLHKGDSLLVQGRVRNDSWTDKEGQKRSATRVEAIRVEALTRGPAAPGSAGATPAGGRQARSTPAPTQGSHSSSPDIEDGLQDFPPPEDDLPF